MLNDKQIGKALLTFEDGYSELDFDVLGSVFASEFRCELTKETEYSDKTRKQAQEYFEGIAAKRDWQKAEFFTFEAQENDDGTTHVFTTAIIDFADEKGVEQPTKFLAFDMDLDDNGEIIRFKSDATNIDPRLEWGAPADNCTFD